MNVLGQFTPTDWVRAGWVQVILPAGETRSEKIDGIQEVRPEVWNQDGVLLSGRKPATVKDGSIEVEDAAGYNLVMVVSRTGKGAPVATNLEENPAAALTAGGQVGGTGGTTEQATDAEKTGATDGQPSPATGSGLAGGSGDVGNTGKPSGDASEKPSGEAAGTGASAPRARGGSASRLP